MFLDHIWIAISIFTIAIYGFVLLKLVLAFKKKEPRDYHIISGLSIVVPVKNEALFIEPFLSNLVARQWNRLEVELILINDHSTDDSIARLKPFEEPLDIRVVNAPEAISGKKRCARLGVEMAKYPWILTLDVDTQLPKSFFEKIASAIPTAILYAIVPLKPRRYKSLVRYFFDLEFISLHFVGMASAKMGKPLLSNAACSIFKKEAFLRTVEKRSDWEIPSGDDVFAMFAIAEKYGDGAIGLAEIGEEKIEVNFPKSTSALWRQRLRWVGKSGQVKNVWFAFVSILVFVFNLVLGAALVETIFHDFSTNKFVFLIAAMGIQFSFLMYVCKAVGRRDLIMWIVPLSVVYPFYLIALVIAQFLWKPKWK